MKMRPACYVSLVLVLGLAGVRAQEPARDTEQIRGAWEVDEIVQNGKKVTRDKIGNTRLAFDGKRLIMVGPRGKQTFLYRLDPTKDPRSIDLTALDGPNAGRKDPGIYELTEDLLRLCLPMQKTKDRPAEFRSAERSNLVLMSLRRVKK
jgi:uncharacterized protein (TIGR03067 family)